MSNDNDNSKIVNKDTKEKKTEIVKKLVEDSKDKKEPSKKVISLSKAVEENTKITVKEKTEENKEVKREKIKLDELVKKSNETEKSSEKNSDVIVSFSDEKNKAKASVSKSKAQDEKAKKEMAKEISKNIKLVGGTKSEEDIKEKKKAEDKEKKEESEIKEEINLDVLGVKRAVEPNIIWDKVKEALITFGLIVAGLFIIIILPIFNVNEVNVTGLNLLTKEEIMEEIGYNKIKNFFYLYLSNVNKKVSAMPQVNQVSSQFTFPNILNIRIEEINIAGYIPYLTDEYIYIDSYGKIVDISNKKLDGIPLIEGLNFKSFKLGNILDTSNKDSLNIIIEITNVLNKYELANRIDSIDVTSSDDLKLYIGNIEVDLGEIEDVDQKIRIAIEAINNLATNAKGVLNVSSSSAKVYFRPIA